MIDAEGNDRLIRRVFADKRDVGAVEGSNHRNLNALGSENLLGHKSRRGMRNGVVYVQQIELYVLGYIYHLAGQCQLVRRIIEEWIAGNIDFVVKKILIEEV